MPRYWQFLVQEMILQMALISIALVIIGVVLIYISRQYAYKPRLVTGLCVISNFFSITAMLLIFAAGISAMLELMYREALYMLILFIFIMVVAILVTKDSSSA
ncbi:MAG: hypothetical protein KKG64_03920 [Firmicutes bacterium]|nr:hypothetical protein [Bacillota bacterium]